MARDSLGTLPSRESPRSHSYCSGVLQIEPLELSSDGVRAHAQMTKTHDPYFLPGLATSSRLGSTTVARVGPVGASVRSTPDAISMMPQKELPVSSVLTSCEITMNVSHDAVPADERRLQLSCCIPPRAAPHRPCRPTAPARGPS